jgi:NAD-dependent aldehyde dehydrogenases
MIKQLVQAQKDFFASRKTHDAAFRKHYLILLYQEITDREDAICDALYADFKKPRFESLATETQFALGELKHMIKHLGRWSKPKRVTASLTNFPSREWIQYEPFGSVLIIAPWNYPFMLVISPLIGALAAGNTAVIKPSELSPNTSGIIAEIIKKVFPPEYVTVVEGGVEVSTQLLAEPWDYIFFTGSTQVGKIVYKSAAEHLTPVTLELSGKNPCVVDETAKIDLAAKRIAWGKFLNAGQTCIAPDYVLVHETQKEALIAALKTYITDFYGSTIAESPDFARITTAKHYAGLKAKLEGQNIVFGGHCNDEDQYVEPTLVENPELDSALMTDEIFGPILPIIGYTTEDDIHKKVKRRGKPLAFYVFSNNTNFQKRMMAQYPFGGGTINDTVIHISNKKLPFGGVGGSGIGGYHGKFSFELFSHKKAIVKRGTWLDIPIRYAPYKIPVQWAKRIKNLF